MGRRILNRKELRADYEAAERKEDEETDETEDEVDDEAEDEEEGDGEEGEAEEEAAEDDEDGEGDEDEDAPKKRKKPAAKPKPKAKPKAKPRSRTKVVRMKVVWGVFNNSNVRVATYEYPKRKDADDHAARLTTDKKLTHFVQPVKEPMEEKKES